jgi:hypothetical protein
MLRWVRALIERLAVTIVLWLPMMATWLWLLGWYTKWIDAGHAQGRDGPPGELMMSLPLWLLVIAWYLAGALLRRLERLWTPRGG